MNKMSLVVGVVSIVLAIVIFVFADGLRRWYSGLLFVVIAAVMFINAGRWRKPAE